MPTSTLSTCVAQRADRHRPGAIAALDRFAARQELGYQLDLKSLEWAQWMKEYGPVPPAAGTIYVAGHPSQYGGADTELFHQIHLWRAHDVDVTLVPLGGANEQARRQCLELGCRYADYTPGVFKHRLVVSFCSGEFLKRLPEIHAAGKPRCVVWFNCMTWCFEAEKAAVKAGLIDLHGFQTTYQRQAIEAVLSKLGTVRAMEGYVPFYTADADPHGLRPGPNLTGEQRPFTVGRVSRDDAAKYPADFWQTFRSLHDRCPEARMVLLGWGNNAKTKTGPIPSDLLDSVTLAPPAGFEVADAYARMHVLLHRTGGSKENFPRTVLEAYHAGVIPVIEDAWGLAEVVEQGVTGFRCRTSDEAVDRCEQLAADPELRCRMAEAGRAFLKERLSDTAAWPAWQRLLQRTASKEPTKPGCTTCSKIAHGVTGLAKVGLQAIGLPVDQADTQTIYDRRRKCSPCPLRTGVTCSKCDCIIAAKTRLKSESCPIGEW